MNSPYLIIRRLIVVGPTNEYSFSFREGVNLIWGDMDCGKSSILNLIDYCLGGKNERLMFAEMKRHGRVALLEADLNGNICTFERNILSAADLVRVYATTYERRVGTYPKFMAASPSESAPDGWLSDFILDNLGIPRVLIKESRYRDDASSDRLSFRDLMKLLYLKQTKIGAESLLDYGNPAVFNKNVEIQKFVYNVYDEQLTQLQSQLAQASQALSIARQNEEHIRRFLSDIQIDASKLADLDEDVSQKTALLTEIEDEIHGLKNNFLLASNISQEISDVIREMNSGLAHLTAERAGLERQYENFVRLGNTYRYDQDVLETAKLAQTQFGTRIESTVPCPLCAQPVNSDASNISQEEIQRELRSVKNRLAGVEEVLDEMRDKLASARSNEHILRSRLLEAKRSFDENNITAISPLISSIQALEATRTTVSVEVAEAQKNARIATKYSEVGKEIEVQVVLIDKIRQSIKIAQERLLGLADVVQDLTAGFQSYMRASGLQNVHDVYIDNKFIPIFRGISYYNTSSGGVRTITSIGSFLARLKYVLSHPANLPPFLMVDTPGQNIGRFRAGDDSSDLSDPKLYENIFTQMFSVVRAAVDSGQRCQIIVVDNDAPDLAENAFFSIVRRFSKQGGKYEKGLFADA